MAEIHDPTSAARAQADATTELAVQIGHLTEILGEMRTTGERADRRGRWTSVVGAVAALALMTGLAVTIAGINERNDRAEQSARILEAIQANQAVIQSCTSPGHQCYDENQSRSNARLAPIISVLCDALPPEKRRPPCP